MAIGYQLNVPQDENKRLEDNDKKARGVINDRLDNLLFDVQDVMNSREVASGETLNAEMDEL